MADTYKSRWFENEHTFVRCWLPRRLSRFDSGLGYWVWDGWGMWHLERIRCWHGEVMYRRRPEGGTIRIGFLS